MFLFALSTLTLVSLSLLFPPPSKSMAAMQFPVDFLQYLSLYLSLSVLFQKYLGHYIITKTTLILFLLRIRLIYHPMNRRESGSHSKVNSIKHHLLESLRNSRFHFWWLSDIGCYIDLYNLMNINASIFLWDRTYYITSTQAKATGNSGWFRRRSRTIFLVVYKLHWVYSCYIIAYWRQWFLRYTVV